MKFPNILNNGSDRTVTTGIDDQKKLNISINASLSFVNTISTTGNAQIIYV